MRVCVVGAGPAGLAFLKELREAGHEATAFEGQDDVGGLFLRCYENARLTSSSLLTAFSDHSDGQEGQPRYWTAVEYVEYLRSYARQFDLLPHIRFRTRVEDIGPAPGGGFTVRTVGPDGAAEVHHFDRVAVCSGTHRVPALPELPGAARFRGRVMHSSELARGSDLAGRRVLILGGGESSSDLALEIARHAASVCISIRSRWGHLVPRHPLETVPTGREIPPDDRPYVADMDTSRAHHNLPLWAGVLVERFRFQRALRLADEYDLPILRLVAEINLRQGTSDLTAFGTKTACFARAVTEHGCTLGPALRELESDRAILIDGTELECDVVLCATGLEASFPLLEASFPEVAERARSPRRNLYKHCFDPELGDAIAFGGFVRPAFGSIPPMAEMQARWFALLCSGERFLPPPDEMRRVIERDERATHERFPHDAPRIEALASFVHYQDQLAEIIGCAPGPELLTEAPDLWLRATIGPLTGAQFRLRGPGAKPELASEVLRRTPYRPRYGWTFLLTSSAFRSMARIPLLGRPFRQPV